MNRLISYLGCSNSFSLLLVFKLDTPDLSMIYFSGLFVTGDTETHLKLKQINTRKIQGLWQNTETSCLIEGRT